MQSNQVINAFAALSHEHRLRVYRLLVERGPEGLPAGDIAENLKLAPSSLTFHVQALHRAGLITQRRVGRQLIYAADFAAMNQVIAFMTENCCGLSESTCAPGCVPAASPKARKARRAA